MTLSGQGSPLRGVPAAKHSQDVFRLVPIQLDCIAALFWPAQIMQHEDMPIAWTAGSIR